MTIDLWGVLQTMALSAFAKGFIAAAAVTSAGVGAIALIGTGGSLGLSGRGGLKSIDVVVAPHISSGQGGAGYMAIVRVDGREQARKICDRKLSASIAIRSLLNKENKGGRVFTGSERPGLDNRLKMEVNRRFGTPLASSVRLSPVSNGQTAKAFTCTAVAKWW